MTLGGTIRVSVGRAFAPAGLVALLILVTLTQGPPTLAQGVLADKPDVQAALNRFTGGHNYASDAERARDQATLFANNDAINKARLNNEIPDAAYQAAQQDFAKLNRDFAEDAAKAAGADFTVQKSSSPDSFSPGTDSDYITVVKDKGQIADMQEGYNKRVNDYLKNNDVPEQRGNWHNKLDTDFMADPTHVTDPNEFRDIAKINNDAYKRRMAAEYERISRAGDGTKIGPEHVNGYMEEMNEFARKKSGKIDDMLAKGPSHFSDPANRADIFQAMAQEQKYNSRLESLDDYLRAQEGLPPRNRGLTASKLGSNRAPGNAANIRAGRAVSEASRMTALEDLAETMGQVAKKNPAFNPNAADDIAKIVEQLPAERRAGVLARIRANGSPGLVDDIVEASARAGRMPPGSSLADDVARAGSKMDDAARIASKLDDLADAGMGRRALGAAVSALEAIGRAADTAEVAVAAARLAGLFSELERALDPDTPPEEAQALLDKIRQTANELRDSAALGAIMQRYPAVAVIYGTWTLGCLGGEMVSPSREAGEIFEGSQATGTCLDRQMSAYDRAKEDFTSWWTGEPTPREANAQKLCDKLKAGIAAGRYRMKDDWTEAEACSWIRYGNPIGHMVEQLQADPDETETAEQEDEKQEVALVPPTCDVSGNESAIATLREAAADGNEGAVAHVAKLEGVNGKIGSANEALEAGRGAFQAGDIAAARTSLNSAKAALDGLGGEPDCAALSGEIATALEKVDRAEGIAERIQASVTACDVDALPLLKSEASSIAPGAFDNELALLETASTGVIQFKDGKATFDAGDYAEAKAPLGHALSSFKELPSGACQTYADRAQEGLDQIEKVLAQQAIVDRAIDTCNVEDLKTILAKYDGRKFRFFTESSARIRAALPKCEEEDRIIAEGKFCDKMRGMVDAASFDFMANRLKAARLQLNALDKKLTPTNTKRCSELNARVQRGLDQLDILEAEQERLTQAESACDVDRLKQLPARYDGKKHPWFKTALARARGAIEACEDERPLTEEEAIADCRRQVEAKGKVYAATDYSPDGSYKCHWCEKGQVSNGVACVWDTAAAEADCRRQASAKGKVYAKTVVHNDGRYDCLWCERGQVYVNGQCGTVAAHGEAECRRLAASKGKVYAKTINRKDGQYECLWCEPGQVYNNGKCGTLAAHNEAKCRQLAASKGKVYAKTVFHKNGKYDCLWCEPGQFYANGRCHYPQQAQPRVQPQPRPSTRTAPPAPCHPGTMGGPDYENCMRSRGLPIPRGNYPR